MLNLDDEYVLEHDRGDEHYPETIPDGATVLAYNDTDPMVLRDGVDRIALRESGPDAFDVWYWGYMVGRGRITRAGVDEIASWLTGYDEIPRWVVVECPEEVPSWLPGEAVKTPTVTCDRCGEGTPATDVLTPLREAGCEDTVCRPCWEEHREAYLERFTAGR